VDTFLEDLQHKGYKAQARSFNIADECALFSIVAILLVCECNGWMEGPFRLVEKASRSEMRLLFARQNSRSGRQKALGVPMS
jgi:hypothetical protein